MAFVNKGGVMGEEKLMSTQEAAAYLGITRQAMHALARRNNLGIRIGKVRAFRKQELDEWVAKARPLGGRPPKSFARTPTPVGLG